MGLEINETIQVALIDSIFVAYALETDRVNN